jgi:hypothetical protein
MASISGYRPPIWLVQDMLSVLWLLLGAIEAGTYSGVYLRTRLPYPYLVPAHLSR